jgi:hypothetical protein
MPLVARDDLRELRVAHRARRGVGSEADAERQDDDAEHAQPRLHAASHHALPVRSSRRKTDTRLRRRRSYPAHFAAGTSPCCTRVKPMRSKNCAARSSIVVANTAARPRRFGFVQQRSISRSPIPSPLKRVIV